MFAIENSEYFVHVSNIFSTIISVQFWERIENSEIKVEFKFENKQKNDQKNPNWRKKDEKL